MDSRAVIHALKGEELMDCSDGVRILRGDHDFGAPLLKGANPESAPAVSLHVTRAAIAMIEDIRVRTVTRVLFMDLPSPLGRGPPRAFSRFHGRTRHRRLCSALQ